MTGKFIFVLFFASLIANELRAGNFCSERVKSYIRIQTDMVDDNGQPRSFRQWTHTRMANSLKLLSLGVLLNLGSWLPRYSTPPPMGPEIYVQIDPSTGNLIYSSAPVEESHLFIGSLPRNVD